MYIFLMGLWWDVQCSALTCIGYVEGAYCSVQIIDYDIHDSESKIMARSLSSMLLKGIAALPATRPSRIVRFKSIC